MSLDTKGKRPVHFPANPSAFAFDAEVAAIFDDMALRAIPNYAEVHRLHASMLADMFTAGAVLCDVGASTGMFFRAVERQIGGKLDAARIQGYAIDSSAPMLARINTEHPHVKTIHGDVAALADLPEQAHVICCLYVLQFMRGTQRAFALDWLARNLRPDGVLILGQKETPPWRHAGRYVEAYMSFRRANGYTQAEIDAKTKALSGAMWVVTQEELVEELAQRGLNYFETTRWVQFASGLATHKG